MEKMAKLMLLLVYEDNSYMTGLDVFSTQGQYI
jgi:hypothetical protein